MNANVGFLEKILDGLCTAIIRRRLLFVIIGLGIVIGLAAGVRQIKTDFTYRAFFSAEDPMRVQVERFEQTFSNDDSVVLLVHSPSGVLDADSSRLVVKLTEAMWRVPDIVRVDSLSNYSWVKADGDNIRVRPMIPDSGLDSQALQAERRAAIKADPLLPNYLISEDEKTTMVVGYVRRDGDKAVEPLPIINAVRNMVEQYKDGDHEYHITGRTAVMAGMQEAAQSDMKRLLPFVVAAIVVLLLAANRQPAGVALPMLVIVLSVISAMGMAGWTGMPISNITAVVPQFILGVAIAEAVHLVSSFYRLRRAGADKKSAAYAALRENALPTFLTSSTTAIGFLSFSNGNITAIDNLGMMVGLGVAMAWVLSFFVLGPLLTVAPYIGRKAKNVQAASAAEVTLKPWPWLTSYVAALQRMSLPIVLAVVALTGVALFIGSQNKVNSNPFKYFDQSFWLRQSSDFAEKHLRGSQGIEVVVDAGKADGVKDPAFLSKVQRLQSWIDAQPGVVKTVSIIDFLKQTNKSFNGDDQRHFVVPSTGEEVSELMFLYTMNLPKGLDLSNRISLDSSKMRISVRWTLYDSAVATRAAGNIEQAAADLGLHAETTGKMLLFQRMNNYVSGSMFQALAISSALIGLLLLIVYRSWTLGVVGLIVNFMPLPFGMLALYLVGRDVDTGAVVAMSVCLGVVVDDTIFLMHAIRSNAKARLQETMVAAFRHAIGSMLLTNAILILGFSAFMSGAFVPNQNFGLISVSILGVGILFDLIFLPALMFVLYGRREQARNAVLMGADQST